MNNLHRRTHGVGFEARRWRPALGLEVVQALFYMILKDDRNTTRSLASQGSVKYDLMHLLMEKFKHKPRSRLLKLKCIFFFNF